MSLEKLMEIRSKLSKLTQPEPQGDGINEPFKTEEELESGRAARIEKELQAAIGALDSLIAEYKQEWLGEVRSGLAKSAVHESCSARLCSRFHLLQSPDRTKLSGAFSCLRN